MFCNIWLALLALVGSAWGNLSEIPAPENVKLVFVGFRHANRNPGQFLKDDPNEGKWGLEGEAQLTKIGKIQTYAYGQQLRQRYNSSIDSNWKPDQVKVYVSSADRVQGSVQTTLAGLYPPKGYAEWGELEWQPVSYNIDNQLLRMYAVDCPTSNNAWDEIYAAKTPEGAELYAQNKEVIEFVANVTGLEPNLGDIADVADNLEGMKIRKLEFPKWVESNPLGKNIYDDVLNIAEAPQWLCSMHDACRRMMAGYWLDHIYNQLNATSTSDSDDNLKMIIYGTHNEIMSSLLWLMGHERPKGVYFHGSGILEYRDTPDKAVRLIYSEPLHDDYKGRTSMVVKMNFCEDKDWCPLDTFMATIAQRRFSDWEKECKRPDCTCTPATENKGLRKKRQI